MLEHQRVTVILPAYNAAETLARTCAEIPRDIVDDVILTDDASRDDTVSIARSLGLHTIRHDRNRGYGANQKTCYAAALARNADIVVMLHPDYQYSPKLVPAMAAMLVSGHYDGVLASRILGGGALAGEVLLPTPVADQKQVRRLRVGHGRERGEGSGTERECAEGEALPEKSPPIDAVRHVCPPQDLLM